MQGGGVVELARKAAASARYEWAARVAAMRPVRMRNYRGVQRRKNRFYAIIWKTDRSRLVWLGSYETPEEAAYAYDAAARVIRGHGARTNFPEPAPARAAPEPEEEVATDLVLALPTPARQPAAPAHRGHHQRQLPAVHPQVSFDNWLAGGSAAAAAQPQHQQGGPAAALFPHQQQQQQQRSVPLPPFTQFFHLADPATAAAANNGGAAAVVNPPVPRACISTQQSVQVSPTNPASSAQSSTEPVVHAWEFFPAAAPAQHRELPVSQASVSDMAVVGDNFTNDDASSSAAPPPALRLTLDLPGRGGPGGAQ